MHRLCITQGNYVFCWAFFVVFGCTLIRDPLPSSDIDKPLGFKLARTIRTSESQESNIILH